MREIDLVPASYRRQRKQLRFVKILAGVVVGLLATTATARMWLGHAVNTVEQDIARLQAQQTITTRERDELAALGAEQKNLQDQLHLLRGLRSGTAATNLFLIIDEALVEDELWFRHWDFRRAGVTDATGQAVETGYFLVVPDDGQETEEWQVETHMTITGQSQDHATLSEFVTRLLSRPEIEDVRIRRTELHRYDARNLVDFDLAVVINSRVF